MKVKRFFGDNMNEVMVKIREDVGPDAVILSTRTVRQKGLQGIFAKPLTEVMVAYEEASMISATGGRGVESIFASKADPVILKPAAALSQPAAEMAGKPSPKGYSSAPAKSELKVTKPQFEVITRGEAQAAPRPVPSETPKALYASGRKAKEVDPPAQKPAMPIIPASPRGDAQAVPKSPPPAQPASADLEKKVDELARMIDRLAHRLEDGAPANGGTHPGGAGPGDAGTKPPTAGTAHQHPPRAAEPETPILGLLRDQEVESALAHRLIASMGSVASGSEDEREALGRCVIDFLGKPEPIVRSARSQTIVMLAGPTGVGKTTTLIKLAAQFVVQEDLKVGLINADTYRIGAKEQIATYAEILEIPLSVVYSVDGLVGAMKAQADRDVLFIDTAGKKPSDEQHKNELLRIIETCSPDELYLVVSASTGNRAIREIISNYSFLERYKLIVTKLDEVGGVGAVLNARLYSGMPVSFLAGGQRVPEDIMPADPQVVADALLGRSRIW